MFEFIMTLLLGIFMGATIILALAHILDSRNEREMKRRVKLVNAYMEEYEVEFHVAYSTLRKLNFQY